MSFVCFLISWDGAMVSLLSVGGLLPTLLLELYS